MKYIYTTLIGIFLATLSCEDPIDVNIADAEAVLVVDGWIDNMERTQTISLTNSQSYFDNTFAPGVTDASVVVNNKNGENYIFEHQENGRYTWTPDAGQSIGVTGDQFELSIEWDGQSYAALSTLNRVPPIDSIHVEYRENETFSDDGYYAQFIARDPDGLGDAYWIKTWKNDTLFNKPIDFNIAYDGGFDSGSKADGIVFIWPIREFTNELDENGVPVPYNPGDKVYVELQSVSQEAFNFLEITRDQLNNSSNGIFALPLANTKSNITNVTTGQEVLGFFNVGGISTMTKIVEE